MTTNKVCGKGKCKFTDEFCASGDCPYDHDVLKKQKKINILEGNVKEDDINVANNVAQRNSQDLTAQWKKGKIKKGNYWVKYRSGKIDTWELSGGITIESKPEIIEVLAPVPSYKEWQELQECKRVVTSYTMKPIDYDIACETVNKLLDEKTKLKTENQKLKKLLKECNHMILAYSINHDTFPKEKVKDIVTKIEGVLK